MFGAGKLHFFIGGLWSFRESCIFLYGVFGRFSENIFLIVNLDCILNFQVLENIIHFLNYAELLSGLTDKALLVDLIVEIL